MNGKQKCRILKEIRRQIAQQNDVEWVVSECSHKGDCKGTCPKCESEVRQLERELSIRRKIGKTVAIAGISAACVTGLTACSLEDVADYGTELIESVKDYFHIGRQPEVLAGDMDYPPEWVEETTTEEEIFELDGMISSWDMEQEDSAGSYLKH